LWNNPAAVEQLRDLRAQGFSYDQIAARLSERFQVKIGRNQVLGKGRRLQLPRLPIQLNDFDGLPIEVMLGGDVKMTISFARTEKKKPGKPAARRARTVQPQEAAA
jgi:hypothetical protein